MIFQDLNDKKRTLLLLRFTKELIKNSLTDNFEELQNLITFSEKEKERQKRFEHKLIKDKLKQDELERNRPKLTKMPRRPLLAKRQLRVPRFTPRPQKQTQKPIKKKQPTGQPQPQESFQPSINTGQAPTNTSQYPKQKTQKPGQLAINERQSAARRANLKHIKPSIQQEIRMDLKKITPLLDNPKVRSIECIGEGYPVTLRGKAGLQQTKITLTNDEIDHVINEFAKQSRIPTQEGPYRVALGDLIFSAVISKTGSRFIIQRMGNR